MKSCISYKGISLLRTKISAWALNEEENLTRVPMFGKYIPFDNDTSSCR